MEEGEGPRRQLVVLPAAGVEREIGRWLWAVEDARRRTRDALTGLDGPVLEWSDGGEHNTVGTILAHRVPAHSAPWV